MYKDLRFRTPSRRPARINPISFHLNKVSELKLPKKGKKSAYVELVSSFPTLLREKNVLIVNESQLHNSDRVFTRRPDAQVQEVIYFTQKMQTVKYITVTANYISASVENF